MNNNWFPLIIQGLMENFNVRYLSAGFNATHAGAETVWVNSHHHHNNSDITWASKQFYSPATQFFAQQPVKIYINENIDQWIPPQ